MFKPLTTKLKQQVHPYAVLAACLALVGLVTALSGIWHYQYELAHLASPTISVASKNQPTSLTQQPDNALGQTVGQHLEQSGTRPSGSANTKSGSYYARQTTASNASNTAVSTGQQGVAAAAPSAATVTVSLSINGGFKGNLNLSSAASQCDVLSVALQTGLLSNLDMRYSSQYGTYAVYVINGIGDSDSVWWTYTVNGKSPPVGCGKTPVHAGDSINWQYVKQ